MKDAAAIVFGVIIVFILLLGIVWGLEEWGGFAVIALVIAVAAGSIGGDLKRIANALEKIAERGGDHE